MGPLLCCQLYKAIREYRRDEERFVADVLPRMWNIAGVLMFGVRDCDNLYSEHFRGVQHRYSVWKALQNCGLHAGDNKDSQKL